MTNPLYDALIAPHADRSDEFLQCDDGSVVRFKEFVRRVAQMAHVLVKHGVKPGDRVLVQAPKVSDAVALYAGAVQAGAVYLPLNTAYTDDELDYFCGDAEPSLVVCDDKVQDAVSTIADRHGAAVLTLGGAASLSQAADGMPDNFETVSRAPDDLAALLYTSGTTGRSKGAMLTQDNLLSNTKVLTDLWQITDKDRLIHALPIFHTHGLFVALNTSLLAGVQVRLMSAFDLGAILTELPHSTLLMGVPTFYTRLLANEGFTRERCENMRLFISGSAPLLAETHDQFAERTGHRILERYGMTEINMTTSNPYDGDRVAGTVGYPLPGTELKITNPETGTELPHGDIGMIEVRGPNVFQGYWRMPEKTAEELRDDGFFLTGDLGVQAEDGRVSIVGRSKDLIITGGFNVYPKEIEDVINDIAGVSESAVFGIAHTDFGEAPMAAIVPETGVELDIEHVRRRVADKLARFKHPANYVLLTELPRNTMGKVQKNVLRDRYKVA